LRRRRRLLVGGGAIATTCAVLVLGMSDQALPGSNPDGAVTAGRGVGAPADAFPGAPSIQAAVDHYVAAIRAGDGAAMARILEEGYSTQARTARISRAERRPVTVARITYEDMPSSMWKFVVLHLDDAGVPSRERVMVGPASRESQADPRHWKIYLEAPG
jgi:hypothetical protein